MWLGSEIHGFSALVGSPQWTVESIAGESKGVADAPLRGHSGGQCPPHQRVAGSTVPGVVKMANVLLKGSRTRYRPDTKDGSGVVPGVTIQNLRRIKQRELKYEK